MNESLCSYSNCKYTKQFNFSFFFLLSVNLAEVSDYKKDTPPSSTSKDETKVVDKQTSTSVARSSLFRRTIFVDNRFSLTHFATQRRSRSVPNGNNTNNNVDTVSDIEANSGSVVGAAASSSTTNKENIVSHTVEDEIKREKKRTLALRLNFISGFIHIMLFVYFLVATILSTKKSHHSFYTTVYHSIPMGAVTVGMFFGILTLLRKGHHLRFNIFQRFYYWTSAMIYFLGCIVVLAMNSSSSSHHPTDVDKITMAGLTLYAVWVTLEVWICPTPQTLRLPSELTSQNKAHLSKRAIMIILKPYFWPSSTATTNINTTLSSFQSAHINRILAMSTWACVAGSKACSLISPIVLGKASTALTRLDYWTSARLAIIYCTLQFFSNVLKEGQSLVYLSVAKAAFIQLSEHSFRHLHSLSLDWHLRKKLGEGMLSLFNIYIYV